MTTLVFKEQEDDVVIVIIETKRKNQSANQKHLGTIKKYLKGYAFFDRTNTPVIKQLTIEEVKEEINNQFELSQ